MRISIRRAAALFALVAMVAALMFTGVSTAFAEDPDAPQDFAAAWYAGNPTIGTVDYLSDIWDVYRVDVPENKRITFTIFMPEGMDYDSVLWAPGAASIDDPYVAYGMGTTNPEVYSYDVPAGAGGTYFIGIVPYASGTGEYTLSWTIEDIPPPPVYEDIPGQPLPDAQPVVGTVDPVQYFNVWSVDLAEGDTFTASLTADAEGTALALLDPSSVSIVNGPANVVQYSPGAGYPEVLSYTVPAGMGGTYYVVPFNQFSLVSNYAFEWSIGNTPPPPGGSDVTIDASVGQAPPALTFSIWGYEPPSGGNVGNNFVEFGYLTPEQPKMGSQILDVSTNYPLGYQVVASENHPLAGDAGIIPDTVGDYGDITEWNFGQWEFPTTPGFGFMTYGAGSIWEGAYRQFADASLAEAPQPVMMNGFATWDQMVLSYKLNVDYMQPDGYYSNTITYMATGLF